MAERDAVAIVARQQWRMLVRDRRLALLGLALLLALLTALATGAAGVAQRDAERSIAQAEEARIWNAQGEANPHGAAHFGRYVYRPPSPLAVIDPGLLPQLGSMLRLEAHMQNPASGRAMDAGVSLDRFGGLSAATMLQVLAPLIVILAGFGAFAGDTSRVLLRQELASGTSPTALMLGRLAGLAGSILVILALVFLCGLAAVLIAGGGADDATALTAMATGYALYLFAFAALTLAASAAFGSARVALVMLLGFWAVSTLIVPRIAPAVAASLYPTLSAPAFEAAVTKEVREGPSGHDPMDARLERLKAATLQRYGVATVEELPIDFSGVTLLHGEALSTAIYRRHFDQLYDAYARQAAIGRASALLSPAMAVRPWSAGLARADQQAHRELLTQGDAFRFQLVQALNRDMMFNRKVKDSPYLTDVAAVTAGHRFTYRPASLPTLIGRQLADLLILIGWAAGALGLALLAARRLRRSAL